MVAEGDILVFVQDRTEESPCLISSPSWPFLKPLVYISGRPRNIDPQPLACLSCLVIEANPDDASDDTVLWDGVICLLSKDDLCLFEVLVA